MSTITIFSGLIVKQLDQLQTEITSYSNETDLWKTGKGFSNSAGNLALHLIGNLNHFIGAQLCGTSYIREREKEFSQKHIPVHLINEQINACQTMIAIFATRENIDLTGIYPLETFGPSKTIEEVLFLLLGHFNYHLGQINYHRRIINS